MWDKPSSACVWSGVFSRGCPVFAPLNDWLSSKWVKYSCCAVNTPLPKQKKELCKKKDQKYFPSSTVLNSFWGLSMDSVGQQSALIYFASIYCIDKLFLSRLSATVWLYDWNYYFYVCCVCVIQMRKKNKINLHSLQKCRSASMAEWLRLLIFSALNCSSSHRCGFEPCSGHLRDKPNSACRWSSGFSQESSIFAPPYDRLCSEWVKWSWWAVKPK